MEPSINRSPETIRTPTGQNSRLGMQQMHPPHLSKRLEYRRVACSMLGINFDDLTLRTKEEVYDPKKLREVNEAIYAHYLKKYHFRVAKVESKVEELMNMQKSDRGKLFGQLLGTYGQGQGQGHGHHRKTRSEANLRLPKISNTPSDNHSQTGAQTQRVHPRSSPYRGGLKNRSQVESICDSSIASKDFDFGDNEITAGIISRYQLKLQNLQEHWNNETKNMRNVPVNNTNELLSAALQNQVAKINKGIEKAEKYAQSLVEAENQRRELEEEIEIKNQRSEQVLQKIQRSRSETVKKHHEVEEEKKKSIKEQKRDFNISMRKKNQKLRQRFDELRGTLEKREEERVEQIQAQSVAYIEKVAKAKEKREIQSQQLFEKLQSEDLKSARHLNLLRTERQMMYEERANAFEESSNKAKELRDQINEQKKFNTLQELCKKSMETEQIRNAIKTRLLSKAKETAEKMEHHRENYREVVRNKNKWVRNIIKTYQQSQEHIQEAEEEKSKKIMVKKELSKLRKQDQEGNLAELMKNKEIRDWQIIEKGKTDHLKLVLLKEQNNILSQARIDVDRVMKQKMTHLVDSILKERKQKSPSPKKGGATPGVEPSENDQSPLLSPQKNSSPMNFRSM